MAKLFTRWFTRNTASPPNKKEGVNRDLIVTAIIVAVTLLIGLVALVLWTASAAPAGKGVATSGLGMLLFGGAILAGGVLGLLFGIPKSVSDPASVPPRRSLARPPGRSSARTSATTDNDEHQTAESVHRSSYMVNTNLEQISDWLTKIIVGVSLTQIPTIREQFANIARYFGDGLCNAGDCKTGTAAAALIIIYGLTTGFLAGYLFTRIFLPGAFRRADRETELLQRISEQQNVIETLGRVNADIYTDLYRYKQQGFRKVISKINELLKSEANQRNPALWVYLAAAHGQAYSWAHARKPPAKNKEKMEQREKDLDDHRDAALMAVRMALALGDAWKPILQVMWNPDHEVKDDGQAKDEDDLEVFYHDKRFKRLLAD
jgi:hypothetical protein